MKKPAFHIVRVGLGITFLWIGILIFAQPEQWGNLLLPWAAGILPIPLYEAMIGTAVLDIVIGFFLLIDVATWFFASLAFLHLVTVIIVVGIRAGTARDLGLLAASLALIFDAWPFKWPPHQNESAKRPHSAS